MSISQGESKCLSLRKNTNIIPPIVPLKSKELPMLRIILVPLFAVILSVQVLGPAGRSEKSTYIVSSSWVAERLGSPEVVLLHVGDKAQYDTAHIPGAQYIGTSEISTPRGEGLLTLEIPSVSQLDSAFESKGISDNSIVVVYYGNDWVSPTGRVYLTLDYIGLSDRTYILDGGMRAWTREGRSVTSNVVTPKRGSFTPHEQKDVIAHLDWVKKNLDNSSVSIVDARTPDFYSGERLGNADRPGHIPGATNIPYSDMVDDSLMFKPIETLREMFLQNGVGSGETVVSYCHIGQQASLVYFVARLLGYDARMYDGSAQEWSRNPVLPLVVEKQAARQ